MNTKNAFRNLMLYLTMGMDNCEPNDFSTFVEAGIFLSKQERREMIQLLTDYEALRVSDQEIEALWNGSGARFFLSPERARRQFLYIARLYLEQSMLRPDIEDLKAGQRRGVIVKRPLSRQHSKAAAHLFRECAEPSPQRQARFGSANAFWKEAFDGEDKAVIAGIARDIAAAKNGEEELEAVLRSIGVEKAAILSPSLRELIFLAAFEFERRR